MRLKVITIFVVLLCTISSLFADGEQYIDAYNGLVKALNPRLKAAGMAEIDLKDPDKTNPDDPYDISVTQSDLNDLRTKVLDLGEDHYLLEEPSFGNEPETNKGNVEAWLNKTPAIHSDSEKETIMSDVGNGLDTFTKVPKQYVRENEDIYNNDFTDVPLLWIHFHELSQVIAKLKYVKRSVSYFDIQTRFISTGYKTSVRGNTFSYSVSGVAEPTVPEGLLPWNYRDNLSICNGKWNDSKWVAGTGTPGWSVSFYKGSSINGPAGQVGFTAWSLKIERIRAKAQITNVPELENGKLYGITHNSNTNEDQPISEYAIITGTATWDGDSLVSEEYFPQGEGAPKAIPPGEPTIYTPESESLTVSSMICVASGNFPAPSISNPNDSDSQADGLLATGCTCTSCKMSIEEEFNALDDCDEVKYPLGVSNGNDTGLKVKAYIAEKKRAKSYIQMYSLNTKIGTPKTGTDSGKAWGVVSVKRPSGAEVIFSLYNGGNAISTTNGGKPDNGYAYRLKKDGTVYELEFPGDDGKIWHRFGLTGGYVSECRREVDGGVIAKVTSTTVGDWSGLTTDYATGDEGGKIDNVESPFGTAEPIYDDNDFVIDVKQKNLSGELIQTNIARTTVSGTKTTRTYQMKNGSGTLEKEERVTRDSSDGSVIVAEYNVESGTASSVARSVKHTESIDSEGNITLIAVTTVGTQSTTDKSVAKNFAWGREITKEIRADGTDDESSTEYDYYDDKVTDGGAYGKLKSIVQKHGTITTGWTKYEYDSEGRTTKVVTPFGNAAFGSADNLCRVTEYSYTPVVTGDTAGDNDHRIRRVIQKVLGTEISRSYTGYTSSGTKSIRAASSGAAWDAAGNLTTTTEAYDTGTYKGRTKKITHPDGTITVFTYEPSGENIKTTVDKGAGSGTTVTEGTRTATITDTRGNPSSIKTYDVTSSTETLIGDVDYQTRDDWGRELVVEYMDGTKTTTAYGCCGPSSFINREGTTTTTVYNTLKQLDYTETPHPSAGNIKTYYFYDVFGNITSTIQKGTDNSEISTSKSYNVAGDLISSTDAMGNTTIYSISFNENGQRIKKITYPDGTTSVTTYNMDGTLASTSGTAIYGKTYSYTVSGNEIVTTITPAIATQWVKTYTDFLGRNYKTEYADEKTNITYYNSYGQVEKVKNLSNIYSLYSYNTEGDVEYSAIVANPASINNTTDEVNKYEKSIATRDSQNVIRNITKQNIDGAFTEVNRIEISTNGSTFWNKSLGQETKKVTSYDFPADGTKTVTITNPDQSTITNIFEHGKLVSSTDSISGQTSYSYDSHNRLSTVSHSIGGTNQKIEYGYNANNQLTTSKKYAGTTLLTTISFFYDNMGRKTSTTLPEGKIIYHKYSAKGQLEKETGAEIYPKSFSYDNAGRQNVLTTYKIYPSSSANTSFTYSPTRGFLTRKEYDNNKGVSFTHEDDGRLKTRVWERNDLTTTYGYDSFGNQNSTDYSDLTTDISFSNASYPISRATSISVTDSSGNRAVVYKIDGSIDDEPFPLIPDHNIDLGYDSLLRLTDIDLKDSSTTYVSQDYTFSTNASTLSTVSDGANTVTYFSRISGSNLNDVTKYNNGSTDILEEDRDYDSRNRLEKITYKVSSNTVASYTYVYNNLDQRTKCTLEDGSYWEYTYDALGQVTSAKKYTSSGTSIKGQQFSYAYDSIGNRTQSTANEATSIFTSNDVNQYTSRTVPGKIAISGSVDSDAKVAIEKDSDNSVIKVIMQGNYFSQLYSFNNSSCSVEETFKIYAHKTGTFDTQTVDIFIPETPESRTYNDDGCLLSDGKQSYTWNGENRLIAVEKTGDYKVEAKYDYIGRRIEKKIYNWNGSAWQLEKTEKYAWEGWHLIGIFDSSNTLQRSFCWGEGNRLLSEIDHVNNKKYYPIYAANQNIMGYIDSSDGALVARYEYDAFGNIILKSGIKADDFLFKFGSYQYDSTTGLIYYGLRYYDPISGRFVSLDPIGLSGGLNLYANCRNDMINYHDYLGLAHGEGIDYFRSSTWKKLSANGEDEKLKAFYRIFLLRYGNLIKRFSNENCIPQWMLVSVILGERINMDQYIGFPWMEMAPEDEIEEIGGLGSSVGLAQLRVDVAFQRGLTPTANKVKKELDALWEKVKMNSSEELIGKYLEHAVLKQEEAASKVREELFNPFNNIRGSAIYINQLLSEMPGKGYRDCKCRKQALWWPNPSFKVPKCEKEGLYYSAYMGAAHNDNSLKEKYEDYPAHSGKGEGVYSSGAFIQLRQYGFITDKGNLNY